MGANGEATTAHVVWEAQPRQAAFISCPIEDVFFGGARGGGKTDASLGDWISHADLYAQHARGIFFRRSYEELEEVQSRANALFPALGARYLAKRRVWIWPSGATLKMRFLLQDKHASTYQGHSYTWICFEELTNWPNPEPIDKLRACLRSGSAPVPKSFRATGNPGGVGHNWVKLRYIDAAPPFTPHYDAEMECWRVFIPSKLEDNIALTKNDPDYWKRVRASAGGNKELEKAWRYGIWDIVAGGMFDDLWQRDKHVIEPFAIPRSWKVDRAFDWGSSKPFSVGWWAESDGTTAPNGRTYPRGSLFRIAEWYGWNGKPNTGTKMLAVDIATGIVERDYAIGHPVVAGPADTQIFDTENGVCIASDMAKKGVRWLRADKAPGSRRNGWERLRRYMAGAAKFPSEEPGIFIFKNCTEWIRTVPTLPRDKVKTDDVDTDAEDHAGDETRYRLLRRNSAGEMDEETANALAGLN